MMGHTDFYVYILSRPDGTPFYVGKGRLDRIGNHERDYKKKNSHKNQIIASIIKSGLSVQKEKIAEGLSQPDALTIEQDTISRIGRRPNGPLANMTDGGDGMRGYEHSAESIALRRVGQIAAWADPDASARRLSSMRATAATPESRARKSAASKAYACSDEGRANRRRASDVVNRDPIISAKRVASLKATLQTPEARTRKSAAMRLSHADPESKARRVIALKEAWQRRRAAEIAQSNLIQLVLI